MPGNGGGGKELGTKESGNYKLDGKADMPSVKAQTDMGDAEEVKTRYSTSAELCLG